MSGWLCINFNLMDIKFYSQFSNDVFPTGLSRKPEFGSLEASQVEGPGLEVDRIQLVGQTLEVAQPLPAVWISATAGAWNLEAKSLAGLHILPETAVASLAILMEVLVTAVKMELDESVEPKVHSENFRLIVPGYCWNLGFEEACLLDFHQYRPLMMEHLECLLRRVPPVSVVLQAEHCVFWPELLASSLLDPRDAHLFHLSCMRIEQISLCSWDIDCSYLQ